MTSHTPISPAAGRPRNQRRRQDLQPLRPQLRRRAGTTRSSRPHGHEERPRRDDSAVVSGLRPLLRRRRGAVVRPLTVPSSHQSCIAPSNTRTTPTDSTGRALDAVLRVDRSAPSVSPPYMSSCRISFDRPTSAAVGSSPATANAGVGRMGGDFCQLDERGRSVSSREETRFIYLLAAAGRSKEGRMR